MSVLLECKGCLEEDGGSVDAGVARGAFLDVNRLAQVSNIEICTGTIFPMSGRAACPVEIFLHPTSPLLF